MRIKFVKTEAGREKRYRRETGEKKNSKSEQMKKNIKRKTHNKKRYRKNIEGHRFLKTEEIDNKPISLWSFVLTSFIGENWRKSTSKKS